MLENPLCLLYWRVGRGADRFSGALFEPLGVPLYLPRVSDVGFLGHLDRDNKSNLFLAAALN